MSVRVLVAHGSASVRDDIRLHLECMGCDVVAEAETAAQALPLFRTVRPEVVTLGFELPYGGQPTPLDLLRLIKREAPETAVVMLGVVQSHSDAAMFPDEGALECIFEPLDSASFANLCQQLCRAYPELRRMRGRGAIMPNPRQSGGQQA